MLIGLNYFSNSKELFFTSRNPGFLCVCMYCLSICFYSLDVLNDPSIYFAKNCSKYLKQKLLYFPKKCCKLLSVT